MLVRSTASVARVSALIAGAVIFQLSASFAWSDDDPAARSKLAAGGKNAVAKTVTATGEWTQWRGPNRDGISTETGLLKEWPEGGPSLTWQVKGLGSGFSSVAIAGGRIYTMGKKNNAVSIKSERSLFSKKYYMLRSCRQ